MNYKNKHFIWILLKGGADSLNLFPPYSNKDYYAHRPTISVPKEEVIPISSEIGMYPSFKTGLLEFYKQNNLIIIPESGQYHNSKNHYISQSIMESGNYLTDTSSGFLSRILDLDKNLNSMMFSPYYSNTFNGKIINNIQLQNYFSNISPENQKIFLDIFSQDQELASIYSKVIEHKKMMLKNEMKFNNFTNLSLMEKTGVFIKENKVHISFIDNGDFWDTHSLFNPNVIHEYSMEHRDDHKINICNEGRFFNLINTLNDNLLSLKKGLSSDWDNTLIVINTEFGRAVEQNGSQGFDHGYGSPMIITGGLIKSSKIVSDKINLKKENLFENKHLHVKYEYREVIANILLEHFQFTKDDLEHVFPKLSWSFDIKI